MDEFEAIRRLIALYGQLLDSKRFTDWGALFFEDAVFRVWGRTYRGRDEILREIAGMQPEAPGKHVVLQPVIDLEEAGQARVWTDLCALSTGTEGIGIVTIGRYHDRVEQDGRDGRWRFRRRDLVMGGEEVPADVDPSPAF
jgi:hypothetical protein